ncbi:Vacuolar protein sorting-associated protein 51-like protein [Aphelenchoides besseyi]|nr:Vacuolar protein sorting-associated protein 51-like protein [Aphelenchoides besseyi]KAI6207714.1 Vacuolar protein sorting-associated protein 51-like protein [Aphelenchoides besseyi]
MSLSSGKSSGSLNLNSKTFDSDTFVSNLILHKGLDELVTVEEEMVQSVRRLDYEMQHLVYENYNKFLTATNTVRKMQNEFSNMDNQMELLTSKIQRISELSTELSGEFASNRTKIGNLSESSKTIKTLQSLVQLPSKLRTLVDENKFREAGRLYKRFRPKLQAIQSFSSVQGIYRETMGYVAKMERQIWTNLENPIISSEEFINQSKILLDIGVEEELLKSKLTEMWNKSLEKSLQVLEKDAHRSENEKSQFTDILNFADNGVCPFLADVSLIVSLHDQLFKTSKDEALMSIVKADMQRLKTLLTRRFESETNPGECALYVKSLDKIHRKISACCQMMPELDFNVENKAIVLDAAHHQIHISQRGIQSNIRTAVNQIKTDYDASKLETSLSMLITKLEQTFVTSVKSALANLLLFTASDVTFLRAESEHTHHSTFGVDVYEQVVAGSIRELCQVMEEADNDNQVAEFSLLISMVLHSLTRKNLKYLMDLCQEQYKIEEDIAENLLTRPPELIKTVSDCALKLLDKYVDLYCVKLYEILNTEGDNWNEGTTTPKDVRKEAIEYLKQIRKLDQKLEFLLDDSTKKERTPESIRNSRKLNLTSADNRSAIEKMWQDTVEEFTAPVLELKRHSILGCLVDKSLRLFLGWVRKLKFSRVGVQQLQIDSFYFKQNLWKFVADEMCMNVLIDETLSAAVNLCVNPQLLQPTATVLVMDLRTQLCDSGDKYINDPSVEIQWAISSTNKAKIHTNLLLNSNTRQLKLCKDDDRIAELFRSTFPDLQIKEITVDDLKGSNLEKWRGFCMSLNDVKDFNFGALLRLRADRSYTDENTVVVPYVIFLAIEIARNREGVNEECKSSMQENRETVLKTNELDVL